jgi:tetratricopeptide (TPR) repeat protein
MAYRRALKLIGDDPLLESKLGYTEVKMGQKNTGLARLRRAARSVPGMFAIHDRLMKACIITGRVPEAAEAAEKFTNVASHPRMFLRAASIYAQMRRWDKAEEILAKGLQAFPNVAELQAAHVEVSDQKLAVPADSDQASRAAGAS